MFYLLLMLAVQMGICISQSSQPDLQQCASQLACSLDFRDMFQTKLDNVSYYIDLEVALLRHQTNMAIQPLETRLDKLEANTSLQIQGLVGQLGSVQRELAHDREYLGNLTRGLYVLNNDFHQESMVRYQDVHKLVLELAGVQSTLTTLQSSFNAVLQSKNVTAVPTTNSTIAPNTQTRCLDTRKETEELKMNLTFYQNSLTASQKTVSNLMAMESFLQSQVVQLKSNLTSLEQLNAAKDSLILNLQQQLKGALQSASHTAAQVPTASCNSALGMKSGQIPDSALAASESTPGYGPEHARIDNQQGWYTPEKENSHDFLQIDTGSMHYITGVATQGAPCCQVMVTNYTLEYSQDGFTWYGYRHNCQQQYFSGNKGESTVVRHDLATSILARYVRFYVVDFKKDGASNYVGMRTEMYGCTIANANP